MSAKPTPKVAAAGATGAAAIVLIWLLAQFGIEMPGEVGAAVAVLLATGAGYLKTDRGRHAG